MLQRTYGIAAAFLSLTVGNAALAQRQTATFSIGDGWASARKAAVSSDSKLLAALVEGHSSEKEKQDHIRIWDLKSRKEVARLRAKGLTAGAVFAFTADSRRLVCSCRSMILVFDLRTKKVVKEIKPKGMDYFAVALSGDGKTLVVAHDTVEVYTLPDGKRRAVLKPRSRVYRAALSRDGGTLVTSQENGIVRVWDLPKGKILGAIEAGAGAERAEIALSADGKRLAVRAAAFTFDVYDCATRKRLKRLVLNEETKGRLSPKAGMFFTPDAETLALVGQGTGLGIYLWDIKAGKVRGTFDPEIVTQRAAALGADGKTLATAFRSVQVWDISPPKAKR